MNYGETLGYWYLRLNGFIPLPNFVLHGPVPENRYNADADLLAVRFPDVFETVGGQVDDWDNDRFDNWSLGHRDRVVCLVCEVKTGDYTKKGVNNAFSYDRLVYAIRRAGCLARQDADQMARELADNSVARSGRVTIAKMLLARDDRRPSDAAEHGIRMTPCCELDLMDCVRFIEERMLKYREPKGAARMFFPSDLIQFLAWRAGVPQVTDRPNSEEGR